MRGPLVTLLSLSLGSSTAVAPRPVEAKSSALAGVAAEPTAEDPKQL
jgi:hypothetical protein